MINIKYIVYLLPGEWYVGVTKDLKRRLNHHLNITHRDISNWTILAEVGSEQEALNIESHYHSIGYRGKQHTPESIKKRIGAIDYNNRNKHPNFIVRTNNLSKPIIQLTLDGVFIREWSSARAATNEMGYKRTNINKCLKGKSKSSGGYKWEYKKYPSY